MGQLAAIVYTNDNTHWSARFLNKNINHCFICIADRGKWVVLNKKKSGIEVFISDKLPKGVFYQKVYIDKLSLCNQATCVGLVKCLVGMYNPFIFTPYQLYKYLGENHGVQPKKTESNSTRARTRASTRTGAFARSSKKRAQI